MATTSNDLTGIGGRNIWRPSGHDSATAQNGKGRLVMPNCGREWQANQTPQQLPTDLPMMAVRNSSR
ncbi:hypothetical protein CDV36_016066 [Fusarium kuroshium]|uniref:Uncharacterized protein n=4 Tax=Fusarium solani species complex TaxID=232080 RepID=A0A3M2R1D0_9HYPO|nr:hypothetical protein CDV36_016066 [Fusarium kuroshium]RSL41194.1 hypothetical protein CEP51_016609 [Fusarium floridanum]RSL84639.1 hypothetical protein CEP52_016378 [Fusarium oligoseptatum]RSL90410.1 hypothetical protein CDV31_015685 [Fusarium ambrosium]